MTFPRLVLAFQNALITESQDVESSTGSDEDDESKDADFGQAPLVSSSVCQNLDRGKTSKKAAFRTLAAAAAERGESAPSCSVLHTMRIDERKEGAAAIPQEFGDAVSTFQFLTVHLDGIKVLTLDGKRVDGH